jgi:hypothetical protein
LITMQCLEKDVFIFYTINNQNPKMYVAPFMIYNKSSVLFYSAKNNKKSPIQEANFYKLPSDRTVSIKSIYNKSYSGGGAEALIDGIYGDVNWRKGNWQGYQSQDFTASVSFNNLTQLQNITASFLQDQKSWIFFPIQVAFFGSIDGINFELLSTKDIKVDREDSKNSLLEIDYKLTPKQTLKKYKTIKVMAKNYGILPEWHPGKGGDAFIFIDEIEIK